jgi:hypothetical protein
MVKKLLLTSDFGLNGRSGLADEPSYRLLPQQFKQELCYLFILILLFASTAISNAQILPVTTPVASTPPTFAASFTRADTARAIRNPLSQWSTLMSAHLHFYIATLLYN